MTIMICICPCLQDILDAEPELDALDPSLICPVCLDLLHDPFAAIPCKHVFCEPCLRRLGSKNPMNTLCPMCRQRITYCELQRGKLIVSKGWRQDFTIRGIIHTGCL